MYMEALVIWSSTIHIPDVLLTSLAKTMNHFPQVWGRVGTVLIADERVLTVLLAPRRRLWSL